MRAECRAARRRAQTLTDLSLHFTAPQIRGARDCAARLRRALPGPGRIEPAVLVAYGGGKDSTYTVAFVRLVQLLLERELGWTFRLRTATNRHAGMPRAVTRNIERVYRALGFGGDPLVEPLWVDDGVVRPFDADAPVPLALLERNRRDVLMAGHRTHGEGRPTFCNACNFSMVESFRAAAGHGRGVDLIVTGDSRREQRYYIAWVNAASRRLGTKAGTGARGAAGFLDRVHRLSRRYYADLYGPHEGAGNGRPAPAAPDGRLRGFFSIYGDTAYEPEAHWGLLTRFLGFEFDELAFSFSETDCANPALMAHLRGLRCQHFHGQSYGQGIRQYVSFALRLMEEKSFPAHLVEAMRRRYATPEAVRARRREIEAYAGEVYGLTPEHLLCMVYAPFAGGAGGLAHYLGNEHPEHAHRLSAMHRLLGGERACRTGEEKGLAEILVSLSGLPLELLRRLYRSKRYSGLALAERGSADPLPTLLERDPHQSTFEWQLGDEGPVVRDLVTGR